MDNLTQNLSSTTPSVNAFSDADINFENEAVLAPESAPEKVQESTEPGIQTQKDSIDIMDLEGNAHEKLIKLSSLDSNFENDDEEELIVTSNNEKKAPVSLEAKIINIQAEIASLLTSDSISKIDKKDKANLLKSLNLLKEELEKDKNSKKQNLLILIFGFIYFVASLEEKSVDKLQEEVKRTSN